MQQRTDAAGEIEARPSARTSLLVALLPAFVCVRALLVRLPDVHVPERATEERPSLAKIFERAPDVDDLDESRFASSTSSQRTRTSARTKWSELAKHAHDRALRVTEDPRAPRTSDVFVNDYDRADACTFAAIGRERPGTDSGATRDQSPRERGVFFGGRPHRPAGGLNVLLLLRCMPNVTPVSRA
jgi:hypothetical protein